MRTAVPNAKLPWLMTACIPRDTPEQGLGTAVVLIQPFSIGIGRPLATNILHTAKDGTKLATRPTIGTGLVIVLVAYASYRP